MHLIGVVINVIIFLLIAGLFMEEPAIEWGIFALLIIFVVIAIKLSFFINKQVVEKQNKDKNADFTNIKEIKRRNNNKIPVEFEKIKELAQKYIDNNIISSKDELSFDDYTKFNDIVQSKNKIIVPNIYNNKVPYCIRNALYTAYLKRIRNFNKNFD